MDNYRYQYIKNLQWRQTSYEQIHPTVCAKYPDSEWLHITSNLMSCMLIGANFNSKATDVGCSVFNLAQTLADIEKGIYIDDGMGKILCPYAKPLLAGNEEEEDNIFIEYVSAMDEDPQQKLDPKKFFKNDNGIFINKLMEEKNDSGVFIPRPIKSCHPDWVLSYRGCPLAYWEGNMSQSDTTEGLQYTNLCGTNILNYVTNGTPSVVMHTSNVCITLQASRIDDNDETIAVYQRKGLPYFIEPSLSILQIQSQQLPCLFCTVLKGLRSNISVKIHWPT